MSQVLPKQVSSITIQAHEISIFIACKENVRGGEWGGRERDLSEKKRNAKRKSKHENKKKQKQISAERIFSEEISLLFPFLPFLMNRLQQKNGPVSIHQVGVPAPCLT